MPEGRGLVGWCRQCPGHGKLEGVGGLIADPKDYYKKSHVTVSLSMRTTHKIIQGSSVFLNKNLGITFL